MVSRFSHVFAARVIQLIKNRFSYSVLVVIGMLASLSDVSVVAMHHPTDGAGAAQASRATSTHGSQILRSCPEVIPSCWPRQSSKIACLLCHTDFQHHMSSISGSIDELLKFVRSSYVIQPKRALCCLVRLALMLEENKSQYDLKQMQQLCLGPLLSLKDMLSISDAESIFSLGIKTGSWYSFQLLDHYYRSVGRDKKADFLASCLRPQGFRRLDNICTYGKISSSGQQQPCHDGFECVDSHVIDAHNPEVIFELIQDIDMWCINHNSDHMVHLYLKSLVNAAGDLTARIQEHIREAYSIQSVVEHCELFIRALESGYNRIACAVMDAFHKPTVTGENILSYNHAIYFLNQGTRLEPLLQANNQIVRELIMRILESSSKSGSRLLLRFNEDPGAIQVGRIPNSLKECSGDWHVLQKLRLERYLDAHRNDMNVHDRLISIADEVGSLYAHACDDKRAVPFLFPAAQLGHERSREQLVNICLQSPMYIAQGMGWMLHDIPSRATADCPHPATVKLYLLMGGDDDQRKEAFYLFCSLLSDQEEAQYAAVHWSWPIENFIYQKADSGDIYAQLLVAMRALLTCQEVSELNQAYQAIAALDHQQDPWIIYVQSLLAEKIYPHNTSLRKHIHGFGQLCGCDVAHIRDSALEGINRCASVDSPLVSAYLLCHACETNNSINALKILKESLDQQAVIKNCELYCHDRLIRVCQQSAPASFILGLIYKQHMSCAKQCSTERLKATKQAYTEFLRAHKLGYQCTNYLLPVALMLAELYYEVGNLDESMAVEKVMYAISTVEEINHALEQWITSPRLGSNQFNFIVKQLELLAQRDSSIAYKLALRYKDGLTLPSGCCMAVDEAKAKEFARMCAQQKHREGTILYAHMNLADDQASLRERKAAADLLRKKIDCSDSEILYHLKSVDKLYRNFERDNAMRLLENSRTAQAEVRMAVNQLLDLALQLDEITMRFMGLFLKEEHTYKGYVCRADKVKAIEFLTGYNDKHPEDVEVAKALLALLCSQHQTSATTNKRAYDLLMRLSQQSEFSIEPDMYGPLGIVCYRQGDYKQASKLLESSALSAKYAWYAGLSILRDPTVTMKGHIIDYFIRALPLDSAGQHLTDKCADLDFALKEFACNQELCNGIYWLARCALILGFEHKAIKQIIKNKQHFTKDLLVQSKTDPYVATMLFHVANRNQWGMRLDVDITGGQVLNALLNMDNCIEIKSEIVRELLKVASHAHVRPIKNIPVHMVPKIVFASYLLSCYMILCPELNMRNMGLKWFETTEKFLFALKDNRPNVVPLHQRDCFSCLQNAALMCKNYHALVALSFYYALRPNDWYPSEKRSCPHHYYYLLSHEMGSDQICKVATNEHSIHGAGAKPASQACQVIDWGAAVKPVFANFLDIFMAQSYEQSEDISFEKLIAQTCALIGYSLCSDMLKPYNGRQCYVRALTLDPSSFLGHWGMAISLLNEQTSKEGVQAGLEFLTTAISETDDGFPCFYLASIYLKNSSLDIPFIEKNNRKAIEYLNLAVKRGCAEAQELLLILAKRHESNAPDSHVSAARVDMPPVFSSSDDIFDGGGTQKQQALPPGW